MDSPAEAEVARAPHRRRPLIDTNSEAWGLLCGCALALGAATSFAFVRAGILSGFTPGDLILLRFLISGLVFLPLLARWGLPSLAGIGWPRSLVLLLLGGPAFALMQSGGYAFAPLAHGAVIHPASVTIVSTMIAAAFLRERLGPAHIAGATVVVLGIVLISWHGLTAHDPGQSWIGDVLFFASAVLWAVFGVMVRVWRLPAIRAVGVTALLSAVVTVPCYLAWYGGPHVLALPTRLIVQQAVMQGGVQGVIAITAYVQSIRVLGVSRAVLFPALVPAVSVLLGIIIVGEVPTPVQVAGLAMVTVGLLTAIGLFRRLLPAAWTAGATTR